MTVEHTSYFLSGFPHQGIFFFLCICVFTGDISELFVNFQKRYHHVGIKVCPFTVDDNVHSLIMLIRCLIDSFADQAS